MESRINLRILAWATGTGVSDGRVGERVIMRKKIKSSILDLLCWIYSKTF